MASKEATVYIIDCGSTMGERSCGRPLNNLEWALEYVWDRIAATVATERRTAHIGVIGLRTDTTQNCMNSEAEYAHINVLQELGQVKMPELRHLRDNLVASSTAQGDALSAIAIAIQMIMDHCKKLLYKRKIVLVTDGRGPIQVSEMENIIDRMKQDDMKLTILGIDFDDAEFGFKEEGKNQVKADNEEILKHLCEDSNGLYGTLAQAIGELKVPRVKTVKPVPSYRGEIALGNPNVYDTAISINVERYAKTMKANPPSGSQFVLRSMAPTQASPSEAGEADRLATVRSSRTYFVADGDPPDGKIEVSPNELEKGYEYGRTAVYISKSDRNVTTYETESGLDLIGFVEAKKYRRCMDMSRTNMIVAQKLNDRAAMALSSLIHALWELETYAIARFVKKQNEQPRILLLAPNVEPGFECLYDVELPFQEDVRQYKFPPLDRVITVGGKELKEHRNLPSEELVNSMSDLVDGMDLMEFGRDDDGQPAEYAQMDEMYNLAIHRIQQAIRHRALFPDSELPPINEELLRFSQPPEALVKQVQPTLQRLIDAAEVKKVPPKAKGRHGRHEKEQQKPLSNLDIKALLAQMPERRQSRIDPKNAIAEFKQSTISEDPNAFPNACSQMKDIIYNWIRRASDESGYQQAIEALSVMREETAELELPMLYNDMVRELKAKLLVGELGQSKEEVWHYIRHNQLGLLVESETKGGVDDEEARQFTSGC
ncbi:SPOC domain-like protein [Piedraia hortae CBS 480.64]|uniref:ATP-dependent DNA helicase II subunit 2 n=1 Tax=Piedraia hortae CBS 480.64 TaxID=1314780 RepID=A0A6A7C0P6_9PEZI|nr:SPOC domain-like protein [Piedraia hortae CBS 480.64]